jgi:hypothetical protein
VSRKQTGPLPGAGWTRWPHALGYSLTVGDLRADIGPDVDPDTGLLEWHAVVWQGEDRTVLYESWGYPRAAGTDARAWMEA